MSDTLAVATLKKAQTSSQKALENVRDDLTAARASIDILEAKETQLVADYQGFTAAIAKLEQ